MMAVRHVYVHIPFCVRKCGYCSFFSIPSDSVTDFTRFKARYIRSLRNEIELFSEYNQIIPETIYFGGGTPSLLTASEIDSIVSALDPSDGCEITLEMNPAVIASPLGDYRKVVNRVSLGVQSFIDSELKLLGRLHDSAKATDIIGRIREAGFGNLSIDQMYGLPGQGIEEIRFNLARINEIKPEHVSIYCLSLEPDAPMYGALLPEDETVADFYEALRKGLLGYEQYEISNFALHGCQSRHNSAYWDGVDYIGLGAGASGYVDGQRYTNCESVQGYMENIERGIILPDAEMLDREERRKEMVMLSLRKMKGLDLAGYKESFGSDLVQEKVQVVSRLEQDGYVIVEDGFLRLLPKGFFVSNEIIGQIL